MFWNLIFDMITLLLLVYLVARLHFDTTEFEYKLVNCVNNVYNWFKNLFRNGNEL
jgi:hypothetical protein